MGQTSSTAHKPASNLVTITSRNLVRDTELLLSILDQGIRLQQESEDDDGGATTNNYNAKEKNPKEELTSSNSDDQTLLWHPDKDGTILMLVSDSLQNSQSFTNTTTTWTITSELMDRIQTKLPAASSASNSLVTTEILGHAVIFMNLSATRLLLIPADLLQSIPAQSQLIQLLQQQQQSHSDNSPNNEDPSTANSSTTSFFSSGEEGHVVSAKQRGFSSASSITVPSPASVAADLLHDHDNSTIGTNGSPDNLLPYTPKFRTLDVKMLQGSGEYEPFQINSQEGIPIETDLFVGKAMILMKPLNPNDDPFYTEHLFSKKKRSFIVQVQGKFKRKPSGTVYMGYEILKPMKLGLLTKGVCGVLLRFMQSFNPNVVYSFGDDSNASQDHPRVVVPAHTVFNRIAVTPPGQEPPPFTFQPFPEDDAVQKKRMKSKTFEWNTDNTYSFTYFTMYFDFPKWKIVNIPATGPLNLSTFWGDSPLRIVMYEHSGEKSRKHFQKDNQYGFSMQVIHLGDNNKQGKEAENDEASREDVIHLSGRTLAEATSPSKRTTMKHSESMFFPEMPIADNLSDEDEYFHADETIVQFNCDGEPFIIPAGSKTTGLLASIDTFAPAWVEIPSLLGSFSRHYALNVGNRTMFLSRADCDSYIDESGLGAEASAAISNQFSSRLSSSERRRRILGYVLAKSDPASPYGSPLPKEAVEEGVFLKRTEPPDNEKIDSNTIAYAFVGRALSDRHWIEEWARIEDTGMITFKRNKRSVFRIGAASILSVEALQDELCPLFHNYFFLKMESIGRSTYLMFASKVERDSWIKAIESLLEREAGGERGYKSSDEMTSTNSRLMDVDSPSREFMHHSSLWDSKRKRIYNCSTFYFRSGIEPTDALDPIAMSQKSLKLAIDAKDDESLIRFLRHVAKFKTVKLQAFSESERTAFFLNLYHTMEMHAFLILGPPTTATRFINMFKEVAYEIDDDTVSLAQLEHCIIRANMSAPSNFLSRFVIPKGQYRHVLRKDFRINFALNCGSKSTPVKVPIYSPEDLDNQLCRASQLALQGTTVVQGLRDVIITLPKVCQWFSEDFGKSQDLIQRIIPFLPEIEARKLENVEPSRISIKYMDFEFDCRPLTLL